MGKLKRIVIWSIVIFVVAGLAWQTFRVVFYKEPVLIYSESKGSLDIKLIAIRHDSESVFYDVYGNRIELMLLDITKQLNAKKSYYSLDFVFELLDDKEIFFSPRLMRTLIQEKYHSVSSQGYRIIDFDGRKLLIVKEMIRNYHVVGFFGANRERFSHIDLQLTYFHAPQKGNYPTNVTFKGPFKVGTSPTSLTSYKPTLLFNPDIIDESGVATANFDITITNNQCLIVYDKAGKIYIPSSVSKKSNQWNGDYICYVKGLKLSEIDSIEFRRNSDSKFFRNVKINRPANEK